MVEEIENKYRSLCLEPSDINEHLPVLRKYAEQCETILELGVRYAVSTYAFLAANPKQLTSVDIDRTPQINDLEKFPNFKFIQANDLDITPEPVDLTFIDTDHTYEQLSQELKKFAPYTKKYLIMHDTTVYPRQYKAVEEFLVVNNWRLELKLENNNGLTILRNETGSSK